MSEDLSNEFSRHSPRDASNSCGLSEYLSLGASLYMPATRNLSLDLRSARLRHVRSVILCTEDAVRERDLPLALERLSALLSEPHCPQDIYLRPRNPTVLGALLGLPWRGRVKGLVLPKIDERRLDEYAALLAPHPELVIMPTIETSLAFSRPQLEALRDQLSSLPLRVLCVRIGANDLYALLGLKRSRGLSVYDGPLRRVIDDVLLCFKAHGYHVAAPVFDYLDDDATLLRELSHDHAYGLWCKSAIHPRQVALIEDACRVPREELQSARAAMREGCDAVFQLHGQMLEPAVHRPWAQQVMCRIERFGLASRSTEARAASTTL